MKTPQVIFCMVLLYLSLAVPGSAQVNTASLTGIVTDSQGASVANAAVTVMNKATGTQNAATTDASGYYTFASLPVGAYTLQVELQGFKRAVQENVNLEVGQKVAAGQVVALSGTSGNSSGPHLHFEVHLNNDRSSASAVDPVQFMAEHGSPLGASQ